MGEKLILGVDEAGRGPLAGPVVCAAVLFRADFKHRLIQDSKALSRKKREEAFSIIISESLGASVAYTNAPDIDKINIRQATLMAMKNAVSKHLPLSPDTLVIVDGRDTIPDIDILQKAQVKADRDICAVSAASIVAKVLRDWLMDMYDEIYPGMNFCKNAGYGTKEHIDNLRVLGVSPIHRKSFIGRILSFPERPLF